MMKCAYKNCKNTSIKFSKYCQKHTHGKLTGVKIMHKPKPQEVLTALCAAVAAKYKDEGDTTKAGVVIACLSHEPPRYYASVARYPDTPLRKQVVCQVGKFSEQTIYETAEAAVVALAQKWAEANRPAPVRETLESLDDVLNTMPVDGKW